MLKATSPDEALLHLERAKLLHDSVYQQETAEAISRYNAIYNIDMLQQEADHARKQRHTFLMIALALLVVVVLLCIGAWITYRRNRRKTEDYEQERRSMQRRYDEISRRYRNIVMESLPDRSTLTDEDRSFLEELTKVIDEEMENGNTDLKSVSSRMHTTEQTLRRRLTKTLGVTPQVYFTQVRMKKAKYLLLNYRDITISEVAEKCGYTLMTNFTRAFARYYGIKPSEVRLQKPDTEITPPPAKGGIAENNPSSQT